MAFVFVQLAADTFVRANENPLNPANWTVGTDGYFPLNIVSNTCRATDATNTDDNLEVFTGTPLPNDQYAEYKLTRLIDGETSAIGARVDSTGDFGVFLFFSDNGDGTVVCEILSFYSLTDPNSPATIFENDALPFAANDVVRIAVIGKTAYAFQNGNQIGTGTDPNMVPSGSPCIDIETDTLNAVRITNFTAGSAALSNTDDIHSVDMFVTAFTNKQHSADLFAIMPLALSIHSADMFIQDPLSHNADVIERTNLVLTQVSRTTQIS